MPRKKNSEKVEHWRGVLARHAKSGLSIRQFCVRERVSQPSFYAWRRKLGERKRSATRSRTSNRQTGNGQFIPLKVSDTASLEIVHPLGCRIRITGEVNVTALQHVLEVLDGRSDQ